MIIVERPNQEALTKAIVIYMDAIRPFLTRNLRQVSGKTPEEALQKSLPQETAGNFAKNRLKADNLESAIEASYVEHVVENYWQDIFARYFRDRRDASTKMRRVKSARNQVAHPTFLRDLDGIETLDQLGIIVELLASIEAEEESKAVADIMAELKDPGGQDRKEAESYKNLERKYRKKADKLSDTNRKLKKGESAREIAEQRAQIAENSSRQANEELQKEAAARKEAEEAAGEIKSSLSKAKSKLYSANSKLEKEKSARHEAEKRTQVAEVSLRQAYEDLQLEGVARKDAEKLFEEEANARQLAEQASQQLREVLKKTEKELLATEGNLKKANEKSTNMESTNRAKESLAQHVLNDKPFDSRTKEYEQWLLDEIFSERLGRAELRVLADDNRVSGRLVYFVQAAASDMNGKAWKGYLTGRRKALRRNRKISTFVANQQNSRLLGATHH